MGGIGQVLLQKNGEGLGVGGTGAATGADRGEAALFCRRGEGEVLQVLGTRTRFLCAGEATQRAFSLMEVDVPAGFGPPLHRHPWAEGYYILSGAVGFTVDGRQVVASAGDFLYAPALVPHSFCGQSEEPAQMLIFDLPAHAQAFFRAIDREVKSIPADLHKLPALGAEHHLEFL